MSFAETVPDTGEARVQQKTYLALLPILMSSVQEPGLPNTAASSQSDILDAIARERRVSCLAMGHRWFDLKPPISLMRAMSVVTPQKAVHGDSSKLMPSPDDIRADQNLKQIRI